MKNEELLLSAGQGRGKQTLENKLNNQLYANVNIINTNFKNNSCFWVQGP